MNDSTKKIRVANIIEEGKLGGPQIRIANVAAALKSRIETIVVLPLENSELFRAKLESYDIPYKAFNLSRITKEARVALCYLFFSLYEILRLTHYFRKENFDLIHVSGGAWQVKGVIAGKLAGIKVIWHLNDTSTPGFIRKMFSWVSYLADGFIFASERSKNYYLPLIKGNKPEFVIPAPVDTSRFDPGLNYPGEKDLIDKWSGKFVIGTVANINPVKGLEIFIQAAAIVNKTVSEVLFVVIGSVYKKQKKHFEQLNLLCSELEVKNIDFVGSRSDVRPLLKRFDAYVCCSHAESSPIAVWEAMAMRKPIVSTDVGDVSKYIRDEENGCIVCNGDYQGIAKCVIHLINNRNAQLQFGQAAREIAKMKLDLKHCADRHFGAYLSMTRGE